MLIDAANKSKSLLLFCSYFGKILFKLQKFVKVRVGSCPQNMVF